MLTIAEIRRILDCARENTLCNYDANDPESHQVRLSLEQAESISKSLVRLERLLAAQIEGGA
jgi:hypothetical protein